MQKNARGNQRDSGDPSQNSKKKNQQQSNITAFFKKGNTAAASNNAKDEVSSQPNKAAANTDKQQENQPRQTRQQASKQKQKEVVYVQAQQQKEAGSNRVSENSSGRASKEENQNTQTPKRKASEAQTPNKKKPTQHQQESDEEEEVKKQEQIQTIKKLVDKQVKMSAPATPHKQQQQQQDQQQMSQTGRNLRPRKVENYKQMLDGDEVTIKTIIDEQNEIKKKRDKDYSEEPEIEDEDMIDEAQIERASDDEEEDEEFGFEDLRRKASKASSKLKRKPRIVIDDEENESDDQSSAADDDGEDAEDAQEDDSANEVSPRKQNKRKLKAKAKDSAKSLKKRKTQSSKQHEGSKGHAAEEEEETVFIDNLPNDEFEIRRMLKEVKKHIKALEKQFFEEEDSEIEEELKMINNNSKHDEALEAFKESTNMKQFWCIPLSVNVKDFKFDLLAENQMKQGGRLFDVITIDPPWQLSSANPTRGVAIAYETLNDKEILNMPFDKLQTDGFLFIWVINAKYRFAIQMMEEFGYKLVDEISWVKQTVNGKIAKGHGFYLQHAKETCLVGVKGNVKGKARFNIESDVIFSQRRGQSQKPEEIYEIAEALVPNGYYLEIFGRRNNLHNGWVTIGNEL